MNHPFTQHGLVAGLTALTLTIGVFVLGAFVPEFVQRVTAWQVNIIETPTMHPAIVIVNMAPEDGGTCGPANIERTLLATTITALSQAEAKVIAPILPLDGLSSSACGGASADATLIEATALSGRVIFPASAFEPLKNQALGNGYIDQSLSLDTQTVPFGLAIAKGYNQDIAINSSPSLEFSSWGQEPGFQYSLNTILDMPWTELREHVKDKIVILTPEIHEAGLTQIHLLNAALSDPWLYPVASQAQVFIVFILSLGTAWGLLLFPNWKGHTIALVFLGLCLAIALFLQTQWGWILPLSGIVLACTGSMISIRLLQGQLRRVYTSAHLRALEETLSQIRSDLALKETNVLSLVKSLDEARLAEQQSTDRLKQLELAQAEVESTKQHLTEVENELANLRQHSTKNIETPTPLPQNLESLSLECQTFGIITKDPHLLKVFSDIKKAAKISSPILILGETGTGKEVFAKAAHQLSNRARRPFIPVNMAAIRPELFESELFGHVKGGFTGAIGAKGYVEAAEGGTLFLDEMGELGLDLQAKLLRLLENHTFNRVGEAQTRQANVRILVATNRDLKQEVEQGRFREDLYYRLRSIVLYLPALRERVPEDRRLLAEHFLEQLAIQSQRDTIQLHREAQETIRSYPWPGNIRELKQTLSQAVALADTNLLTKVDLRLDENDSPSKQRQSLIPPTPTLSQTKKTPPRSDDAILADLRQHRFDMGATAKALHCDRSTITQRLKGLGYEALVKSHGDFSLAAKELAEDESLEDIVELKLREYEANLLPLRKRYSTVDEAIADCRRRFKNLPDRYFAAVEVLVRHRFSSS